MTLQEARGEENREEIACAIPAFQVWDGKERGLAPGGLEEHCGHTQAITPLPCPQKKHRLLGVLRWTPTNFITLELSPFKSPPPAHCSPPKACARPQEGLCLRPACGACCLEAQALAAALGLRKRSCKSSGLFSCHTTIAQGRFALVLAQS